MASAELLDNSWQFDDDGGYEELPDIDAVLVRPPPPAAESTKDKVAKRAKAAKSATSAATGTADDGDDACAATNCEEAKGKGAKWCATHKKASQCLANRVRLAQKAWASGGEDGLCPEAVSWGEIQKSQLLETAIVTAL